MKPSIPAYRSTSSRSTSRSTRSHVVQIGPEDGPGIHIDVDDDVRGIVHMGGTVLGTTNRGNPFAQPIVTPESDLAEPKAPDGEAA